MTERYSDQKKDRILQNPLFDKIQNYLEEASGTRKIVYVIAPYVKASVLERLLENVDARIVVITSWKAEDLAHGASDVETYQVCERFGARLYVNNTIHLKVYSIDFDDAILSTANVSRRGLGVDTDNPSVECATLIHDLSENDRLYLASIQKNAILVDDDMYSWAKIWISKQEIVPAVVGKHEIADMMYKKKSFLISALPMSRTVEEFVQCYLNIEKNNTIEDTEMRNCAFHDIANYSIPIGLSADEFRIKLKEAFFKHPFIIKMDGFIENGEHFGSIKAWIQDNCVDVPVPSRRELTANVQVLLKWFEDLGDGLYVVDVPGRHSQRIYKIKK